MEFDELRQGTDKAADLTGKALVLFQGAAAYGALGLAQLSDADFLLGKGQELPIIKATVPTLQYLAIMPIVLWLAHVSLLLQWRTLKRRVSLLTWHPSFGERDVLDELQPFMLTRAALPIGADSILGFFARFLTFLGLVVVPLAVLIAVQVRTLAFHDHALTQLQRCIVLLDLAALWCLMPRAADQTARRAPIAAALSSMLVVLYVTTNAVIPDASVQQLPENMTDQIRLRRLQLQGASLHSPATPGAGIETPLLSLPTRDLRFANMSHAVLTRVDFSGVNLEGADLVGARFISSKFGSVEVQDEQTHGSTKKVATSFAFSRITQSDFRGQQMSGVSFEGVMGANANFTAAGLRATNFRGAALDNADFTAADLRGANLRLSSLVGADLSYARLSLADLTGSDLRGSLFFMTAIFGATFHLADLTYARQAYMGERSRSDLKEALKLTFDSPADSDQAFKDLEALDVLRTSDPMFSLLAQNALWTRYDYLPINSGKFASPSQATYVRMFQALLAAELEDEPRLNMAIERRAATAPYFLNLVYARDSIPHASMPREPPIHVMRKLAFDEYAILRLAAEAANKEGVHDERLMPWERRNGINRNGKRAETEVRTPSWFKKLLLATRAELEKQPDMLANLSADLVRASDGGDDLALSVLAHSLVGDLSKNGNPAKLYVMAAAREKKLEPNAAVALAITFDVKAPEFKVSLDGARGESPELDWQLGKLQEGAAAKEFWRRAATAGHVEAAASIALEEFARSNEADDEDARIDAWKILTRAAFRGVTKAQHDVAVVFNASRDHKEALRWSTLAARDGAANTMNSLAWLLATCPDDSVRDGRRSLDLAMRVLAVMPRNQSQDMNLGRHEAMDTLAASYAEVGLFDRAVEVQTKAIGLLPTKAPAMERADYRARLAAYRKHVAWRNYRGERLLEH